MKKMRQGSFKVTLVLFCISFIDSIDTEDDLISFLQQEESESKQKIENLKEDINTNIKLIDDLEFDLIAANEEIADLEKKMQGVLQTIERWSKPLKSSDLLGLSNFSSESGLQFVVYTPCSRK